MRQLGIPAVFMRGGTSNAIVFHQGDLPDDRALWDPLFLAAIGSPDPNGRQLDGMGGGISSLSKVCVIGPPTHPEADIDYTFAQISVREASVDYSSNCGNMSSAMGPFAVDEGLVKVSDAEASVVIHNTNTSKLIRARFPVDDQRAAVDGDLIIAGVSGSGAPVRLEFFSPGGASTGRLLPSGNVTDTLHVPGHGSLEASMVDAANACVFVEAAAVGLNGTEMPDELDARADTMALLENIRCAAGVAMGIGDSPEQVRRERPSIPKVAVVAGPREARALSGERLGAEEGDLSARMISMGNTHRALPLTGALCLAVAARLRGSIPHRHTRETDDTTGDLRLMHPSGITVVAAHVTHDDHGWQAHQASVYRTQRRLFEGRVLVPASRVGV
jgi:2-methylaconitate cis-trans-isomerase PrpF